MTNKPERLGTLFALYHEQGGHSNLQAVLVLPEGTTAEVVTAAWGYAVMYSAKGLTIPDYDAALVLLKKRHPSWEVIGSGFIPIKLTLAKASDDIPEV